MARGKKTSLKWGNVWQVILIILAVVGVYYLINHTNLFRNNFFENYSNQGGLSSAASVPSVSTNVGNSMAFFDNVQFRPDCCMSSSYSNSVGCACTDKSQNDYLNSRGTNRACGTLF